jgi:hypothetical protein
MRNSSAAGCLFASKSSLRVVTDLAGSAVVNALAALVDVDAVDKEISVT